MSAAERFSNSSPNRNLICRTTISGAVVCGEGVNAGSGVGLGIPPKTPPFRCIGLFEDVFRVHWPVNVAFGLDRIISELYAIQLLPRSFFCC
jgi:hypothetical protein